MEEKELELFGIVPLSADNYLSRPNDMEVMFRGKQFWTYVQTPHLDRSSATNIPGERGSNITDDAVNAEPQMRNHDIAPAFSLMSIDPTYNAALWRRSCPS